MVTLQQLLKTAVQQDASDLHLTANSPPVLRVNGKMIRVKAETLTPEACQQLCYSILTDYQKSRFEENKEFDFSFAIKKMARFRANLFYQKGNVSGVFRKIPLEVPEFENLSLPSSVLQFTDFTNGLVLITGPTGSGKTTTIASLIERINTQKSGHIVTLEDPIEYIFEHKKCVVNQREIGEDTDSFDVAIKSIFRQDPDYVMLGELRDLESIEAAIKIAETGHLVFATLHTNSAVQSLNRIVSVFPKEQQERIRILLSFVLRGVLSQKLIQATGDKVVPAAELMMVNTGIASLIRENKIHQIYGMMQVGQEKSGMTTMNQNLAKHVIRRKVDLKVAFAASPDPEELDSLLQKAGV